MGIGVVRCYRTSLLLWTRHVRDPGGVRTGSRPHLGGFWYTMLIWDSEGCILVRWASSDVVARMIVVGCCHTMDGPIRCWRSLRFKWCGLEAVLDIQSVSKNWEALIHYIEHETM